MGNSWSGLKKELEQVCLCDSLKGTVKYSITKYRTTGMGRFCITVDGKEYIIGHDHLLFHYDYLCPMINKIEKETIDGVICERCGIVHADKENVKKALIENGNFPIDYITEAIISYLNISIQDSLASENLLIRMLTLMDRRVGKRTLLKLSAEIENQPDWLKPFYILRLDAEKIEYIR